MKSILNLKFWLSMPLILTLTACASSRHKFPDFANEVVGKSNLSVVTDIFMYRDIAGTARGVDLELIDASLDNAHNTINDVLNERGFSINPVVTEIGVTHEFKETVEYVLTDKRTSTGKVYSSIFDESKDSVWRSPKAKKFLNSLFATAAKINASKDKDQYFVEEKLAADARLNETQGHEKFSAIDTSGLFDEQLQSEVVLFVNIDGVFVSDAKFFSTSVPMAIATGALTGLSIYPTGTAAHAEVVALNTLTMKILWHGHGHAQGKLCVRNALKAALAQYPYSNGQTVWDKEIERKKARQTKYR